MTLPERADYSLTESALSPFPAEPAHQNTDTKSPPSFPPDFRTAAFFFAFAFIVLFAAISPPSPLTPWISAASLLNP